LRAIGPNCADFASANSRSAAFSSLFRLDAERTRAKAAKLPRRDRTDGRAAQRNMRCRVPERYWPDLLSGTLFDSPTECTACPREHMQRLFVGRLSTKRKL